MRNAIGHKALAGDEECRVGLFDNFLSGFANTVCKADNFILPFFVMFIIGAWPELTGKAAQSYLRALGLCWVLGCLFAVLILPLVRAVLA